MWANWEIVGFVEWLRVHNEDLPEDQKVGFYGLDVCSLWDSIREIIGYLKRVNPEALPAGMCAIKCFEPYGEEGPEYAMATALVPKSCENEVIALLHKVRVTTGKQPVDRESAFSAEQNALVAVDAEHYYRTMIKSDANSWNVRDYHMADTLDRLMRFHGPESKGIVWQHNTHIGDARATDMAQMGEINVGQLVRERHQDAGAVLVGFSGYCGSVSAGSEWGAPIESMPLPPGKQGSWEDVLHTASQDNKLLILDKAVGINEFKERRAIEQSESCIIRDSMPMATTCLLYCLIAMMHFYTSMRQRHFIHCSLQPVKKSFLRKLIRGDYEADIIRRFPLLVKMPRPPYLEYLGFFYSWTHSSSFLTIR